MTDTLILGVPIVVLTPGLVAVLKKSGLPTRYAGVAAIVCAAPGADLPPAARLATWALAGIVYGLAAAGLYTQGKSLTAERNRYGA